MIQRLLVIALMSMCITPVHAQAASTFASRREDRKQMRLAAMSEQAMQMRTHRQQRISARMARREALQIRLEQRDALGDIDRLRQRVLELVNVERAKVNLLPLQYSTEIELPAQEHADDMLQNGYFSHFSRTGDNYADRMKKHGYGVFHAAACMDCTTSSYYGENIAKGQRSAEEVVADWMNSPPHKANILSTVFDEIGIGISGVFWVQNFGAITTRSNKEF